MPISGGGGRPIRVSTSGFVEWRLGTIVGECWRIVVRQTWFPGVEHLERTLQRYLPFSNEERTPAAIGSGPHAPLCVPGTGRTTCPQKTRKC